MTLLEMVALLSVGILCGTVVGRVCIRPNRGRKIWLAYLVVAIVFAMAVTARVLLQFPDEAAFVAIALFTGLLAGWLFVDLRNGIKRTH